MVLRELEASTSFDILIGIVPSARSKENDFIWPVGTGFTSS